MAEILPSPLVSSVPPKRGDVFSILCGCATAKPNREQIASIANWNWEGFDWNTFLRLAEHHGVGALVARNLTTHACGLAREVAQSLGSSYAANLRRNLWFASELVRIVQQFERKQLRVLPYKGPALAQSAYGDLGLRSFSDLDLLISSADFTQAKQVLAEIGYHPSKELAPAVERLWLRTGYERSFDGLGGKNLLELQWDLLPYFYAIDAHAGDFRFDDLLARAQRIALGATDVPCLSAEDSLLALCLHAAKHLWTRLIWVADVAESLRMPGIEFAAVMSSARNLGITRILGVSFWLAEHLLGAAIPVAAHKLLPHDSAVPSIGEECAARLASAASYDLESVEYFWHILKLRERRGDRWRYLWRLALTPGPGDVAVVKLPENMFSLYRVVRMGRLLRKLV